MPEPIRIGIVGLGRAGWGMHCRELQGREDKFRIVAACDLIESRRQRIAEKYACPTYAAVEELIADARVELVDIATRSSDHFAHGAAALRAGKIALMEKPICVDYDQAARLKTIAQESKGALYVRHNRRFEPGFLHVREIIASGILGEVFEIRLFRGGYSRRNDWQTIKEFGGGQLLNWGPHIVDHAVQFLDSPVKSVWSSLRRVAAVGDAEDHLKVIVTGENGRIVDLTISGGAAIGAPECVVLGSRGALTTAGKNLTLKYLDPAKELEARAADPGTPGESFGQPENLPWIEETIPVAPAKRYDIWDELYGAIRLGTAFPITLEQAVENMRVISSAKAGTGF